MKKQEKKLRRHTSFLQIIFSLLLVFLLGSLLYGSTHLPINSSLLHAVSSSIDVMKIKIEYGIYAHKSFTDIIGSLYGEEKKKENTSKATAIPVLVYHTIQDRNTGENIPMSTFKEQMFALKANGYTPVSMQDFYDFMQEKRSLPDKSILITFDDGSKASYYPVDPIFNALDFRGVTFIILKYSAGKGSTYYLSANEIRRVIQTGRWDVQAHTKDGHDVYQTPDPNGEGHYYSSRLWLADKNRLETEEEYKQRIFKDMNDAKTELEKTFHVKSIGFAYPFGDYGINNNTDTYILDASKKVYSLGFHQYWMTAKTPYSYNYPDKHAFLVKRIDVKHDWTGEDLIQTLERGRQKSLPYTDDFKKNNGWVSIWGNIKKENNELIMEPIKNENGSSTYLDGTYAWGDYKISTNVEIKKGSTFTITSRFQDIDNYLECNFINDYVTIEQKVNGKTKQLAIKKQGKQFIIPSAQLQLSMSVKGQTANCSINGKVAISTDKVNSSLSHGGVIMKTWDFDKNNSEIIIKKASFDVN